MSKKTKKLTAQNLSIQDLIPLITKEKVSSRGGGVEISLNKLGFPGELMSAYQNYLGGGMLGCIANDSTKKDWQEDPLLSAAGTLLRQYLHSLTNPDPEDEEGERVWESQTFEQNQAMPISAY